MSSSENIPDVILLNPLTFTEKLSTMLLKRILPLHSKIKLTQVNQGEGNTMSKSCEFQPCLLGWRWVNWPPSTRTDGLGPDAGEGLGWSSEEVKRQLADTDRALPLCSHGVISEIVSSSTQTERTAVPAPRTRCQVLRPDPGRIPSAELTFI